jgi:CheY-specific phosphatase CheX
MSTETMQVASRAQLTAQIINPLIGSVMDTFERMAGVTIQRKDLQCLKGKHPYHPITAVIQLSGRARGSICLSVQRRTAFSIVYRMLEVTETDVTDLVCDTISEFVNVIAGNAKDKLTEFGLQIGLPNVVRGTDCDIWYPATSTPMCANFTSEIGPLMVVFGFSECAE